LLPFLLGSGLTTTAYRQMGPVETLAALLASADVLLNPETFPQQNTPQMLNPADRLKPY
jgi:hypothetical protein